MIENYWIFVINKPHDEFRHRIKSNLWPIYKYTLNRKKIRIKDKVIFYKTGTNDKTLLGTANIKKIIKIEEEKIHSMIKFQDILILKNPLPIKSLVHELDFIENKEHWGRYMLGGIIHISKNDYDAIIKSA